ncbi:UDP-glucose 4-epimerase GalE [Rhodobacterales bacterium 52_120_T64]|nr:UDP-glucose 4-epimerase GalE [Rhodobacterales bacterium 52_120_T64]
MRVLITGGAGYIGTHTLLEVLAADHEVCVIDNFSNSAPEALERVKALSNRRFTFQKCDMRDREALIGHLTNFKPEAIIHFAGLKAVGESVEMPLEYYENNVQGAINLLHAMKVSGCNNIVFSSSATVYGDPDFLPITEDHPLRSTNPYGRSKLHIEDMLRDVASSNPDFTAAILRYFNPVGAHESGRIGEDPNGIPNNLMPMIAQVAVGRRAQVKVFGNDYDTPDGTGVRDYIHVVDLAKAHIAALDWTKTHREARAFNLGVGKGVSVMEMIEAFAKASGQEIPFQNDPRRESDIATCYADPSRAEAELGWKAKIGLAEMCETCWHWQETNPLGYAIKTRR